MDLKNVTICKDWRYAGMLKKLIILMLFLSGCVTHQQEKQEFRPEVKILYHFWESPSNQFEYIKVNGMLCLRWFGANNQSGISCDWYNFNPTVGGKPMWE